MKLASEIISIVSLIDLVHICNETIEQFDSYQQFEYESRNIMTRFDLNKFLFRRWTDHVDIANNKLNEEHHSSLNDDKVASLISETLFSIKEILKSIKATSSALQR
jgi:dTDP-4-dehydrorhamnose reductase